MTVRVECPSGLVVMVRPWSLGDMGEMAIRASQSNVGDDILLNAVALQFVETADSGPYPFVQIGDASFDWKRVLKADLLWALYRIRAASFPDQPEHGLTGEDYTFEHRCSDPTCEGHKQVSVHRIRLCDLKVRKLPDSSVKVMLSGSSFETKVAGRVVKWVLPTLAIDAPLREYLKRERKRCGNARRPPTPAENLASQVTFIEGVKASDKDLSARARWLASLTAIDWVPLRDAITDAAPVIGTKVDAACDHCGRVTTMSLPLEPSFFAPPDRSEALLDLEEAEAKKQETTGQGTEAETPPETSAPSS